MDHLHPPLARDTVHEDAVFDDTVRFEHHQMLRITRTHAREVHDDYFVARTSHVQNASAVWMCITFWVCYVMLPIGASITGLYEGLLKNLWPAIPAFIGMLAATMLALQVVAPKVRVPRRDKVLVEPYWAAMGAHFLTWMVLQNSLGGLRHFSDMNGLEALTLVGINLVESTLFGLMLGSYARKPGVAIALGVAFQVAFVGLWVLFG
jgi:hypothetical protein